MKTTKPKIKKMTKPVRGMTLKQEERYVRDAYDNFPEASMTLRCHGWDYKKFLFDFTDTEQGDEYTITLPMAINGLRLFVEAIDAGKFPGISRGPNWLDPVDGTGDLDADAFDAMAQMAVFGEVIYG